MMRRNITLRILAGLFPVFLAALLACSPFAHAANGAKTSSPAPDINEKLVNNRAPIHITSDRMEANQEAKTIIFEGHVIVQQNDMTITSNRLKVTLVQGSKTTPGPIDTTPAQRIDYIEFQGDVKVTQQDRLATSDKAIFYEKEQKITLEGHPVVTKGQDRIEGKLITIYLKDNRCVVEGGSGAQVHAVLFPEKKE